MFSKWALAASFALAFIGFGEVQAQSATQWDQKAEPLEGRPGEYRTTSTDTWIRLTPYVGGQFFDGGLLLTPGPVFGLALEFEPADILIASFDVNANVNAFRAIGDLEPVIGWGMGRDFSENRTGTDGDQELPGRALHLAFYMGLKNPELKAGILQPILGLGLGMWNLSGYERDDVPVAGGGTFPVRFKNQQLAHATVFLRLDLDITDHIKFGFNLKNHFIFYATEGDFIGNMEPKKTGLDNMHYAFEPDMYFSIAF